MLSLLYIQGSVRYLFIFVNIEIIFRYLDIFMYSYYDIHIHTTIFTYSHNICLNIVIFTYMYSYIHIHTLPYSNIHT